MDPIAFDVKGDIQGQSSHVVHTVPKSDVHFDGIKTSSPYHGHALWDFARVAQIACLIEDDGEVVALPDDSPAFLSDLPVGPEELWC